MLLMKKRFFDVIRSGAKTTTLRYWLRCCVRPDSIQTVPGLGRVRIDAAEPVDLDKLNDEDARADGFESINSLLHALDELYPPSSRQGRTLYRIRFTYLTESEPPLGSSDT